MREFWYEFLQWYESNGVEEIITWASGVFVIIFAAISKLSLNKSKIREINVVANNKTLKKNHDEVIEQFKKENEELQEQLYKLTVTTEKLVAMNMLILENARVDYKVKNAATKILNYDTGSQAQKVVAEAVKDVLEETIKEVAEKIEKNETVGEYNELVDSLLNKARGNLSNE